MINIGNQNLAIAPDRFKGNGMLNGKRIAVVLPAYNAEKTLEATVRELPDLVDIRILVDDHSSDRTVEVAHQLGLQFYVHDQNYGYGRTSRPAIARRWRKAPTS